MLSNVLTDWQAQARDYLVQGQYAQATQLYEQAIDRDPHLRSHYWQLGLLLLLQEQEEEAQTTWLFALSECEPDEVDACVQELSQILEEEAERREILKEYSIAWAIRQHLREICATDVANLLRIIGLSIELSLFSPEILEEIGLIEQLRTTTLPVNPELVKRVLSNVLLTASASPLLLDFIDACAHVLDAQTLMWLLLPAVMRFGHTCYNPAFGAEIAELFLKYDPNNLEFLSHLAPLHQNVNNYDRGIEVAKYRYSIVNHVAEKAFSNNMILRGLLGAGGYWEEAVEVAKHHEELIDAIIAERPTDLDSVQLARLLNLAYHLVYFKDDPQTWRKRQNQLLTFCQERLQAQAAEQGKQFPHSKRDRSNQRLKIGYISHCMATHSVGWLARWLLQHHDRERFELYGYFVNYRDIYDPLQEFYVQQVDHVYRVGTPHMEAYLEIAERIYQDGVDILIDLDSLTLDTSCEVLALKPAPVQVSWLGWDASGLPAIDYFIADPYVLPDDAQDYYSEKIWRLPQTYLAIDGFEVDVPTLRREDLDIPKDAVTFLSAQRGYKRHRDTARAQLQIIKQVPNSYFLIKGLSDVDSVRAFFLDIAAEEGVAPERLRFLPNSPSSQAHRANLAIADVVLDTFPYNGATTTLETLWMGIPIVTRVGEQFAARNSYTMMMNAGITEGIAFSNDEYIEWGVRLGTDEILRQQVAWKLRQSRQTSPLWNAKQFTREMEQAYEQMWAIYTEKNS